MSTVTVTYYKQMKVMQMVLITTTGGIGLASGILMAKVTACFYGKCILYANLTIDGHSRGKGQDTVVVSSTTIWGDESKCDLVTFEGIGVFIHSFIWLWFYIHMESIRRMQISSTSMINYQVNREGWLFQSSRLQDSKACDAGKALFILPPIMLNSMIFVASIVRAAYISDGYRAFQQRMCITYETGCFNPFFGPAVLQRSKWVLSLTGKVSPPFPFHDAMSAAITLSWLEPLALAAYILVVMVDVFLQANPPIPVNESGSDTVFRSTSEFTESQDTWPDISDTVDHSGVMPDDSQGSVCVDFIRPDRLPPVPHTLLKKWLEERKTPRNTPVSGFRHMTLNIKKKYSPPKADPRRVSIIGSPTVMFSHSLPHPKGSATDIDEVGSSESRNVNDFTLDLRRPSMVPFGPAVSRLSEPGVIDSANGSSVSRRKTGIANSSYVIVPEIIVTASDLPAPSEPPPPEPSSSPTEEILPMADSSKAEARGPSPPEAVATKAKQRTSAKKSAARKTSSAAAGKAKDGNVNRNRPLAESPDEPVAGQTGRKEGKRDDPYDGSPV